MKSVRLYLGFALAGLAACSLAAVPTQAATITFDDLTTRNNFTALGISNNYQGYKWGYSRTPGIASATIPSAIDTGWASATVSNPGQFPAPPPVSGNSYAWNWNGPRSLFIDFLTPHNVGGAFFATFSSTYEQFDANASTIQIFGYDGSNNLIASSGVLQLTHSFQQLTANFTDVTKLEIRAHSDLKWYSIDDIEVSPSIASATPEPTSMALLGLGALPLLRRLRRRQPEAKATA